MWWKFRRHKLAMVCGVIVILIYLVAIFAEFLPVIPQDQYNADYTICPAADAAPDGQFERNCPDRAVCLRL